MLQYLGINNLFNYHRVNTYKNDPDPDIRYSPGMRGMGNWVSNRYSH